MNFINQANQFVCKILGEPQPIINTEYRFNNYIFNIEHNAQVFLYNNLTKQLVQLSDKEYLEAKQNSCSKELRDSLIKTHFLIPVEADEFKTAQQIKETVALFGKKNYINNYTIVTTTDCNARCWYCYQAGGLRTPMSDEIAEKTADFIIGNSKGKKIKLNWFGGEPLFNSSVIDIICCKLLDNKISFASSMISNGYLFDENNISKAKSIWNLKLVQITIDGTEKTYNKSKSYIYKNGSAFKKVMSNIESLLKNNITVTIRLNICENNCDDLLVLSEEIFDRFNSYTNYHMYISPIKNCGRDELAVPQPSNKLIDTFFKISEMIYDNHREENIDDTLRENSCMADNSSAVVIGPTGGIGKCEHFPNSDFLRTLNDLTENKQIAAEWSERFIYDDCKKCPHFPACIKLKKCPNRTVSCTQFDRDILSFHAIKNIKKSIQHYEADK